MSSVLHILILTLKRRLNRIVSKWSYRLLLQKCDQFGWKINHIALDYNQNKQLARYIDSIGIEGLIEWKFAFPIGNSKQFKKRWEKLSDDIGDGRTVCFKRRHKSFLFDEL
ncbi:MAG: hypothetical protein IPM51_10315 [Sphingobacteriaceae bacterium]|nr:hypothetical protein [Sphingobacteriaceae bacterium]